MKIAHLALWTLHLEELRAFYIRYFDGVSNDKYTNPAKGFESYIIRFGEGCALELMRLSDISRKAERPHTGYCHMAFECAGREEVDTRTERLRNDGYRIVGEPRTTGDGFYESVIADPDGNIIELTYDNGR